MTATDTTLDVPRHERRAADPIGAVLSLERGVPASPAAGRPRRDADHRGHGAGLAAFLRSKNVYSTME
ncbi:MAG TPA: hypothetical protein VIL48_23785 [Acidimicrobiales bacterium]|jgi:hypothetical protein